MGTLLLMFCLISRVFGNTSGLLTSLHLLSVPYHMRRSVVDSVVTDVPFLPGGEYRG